MCRRTIVSLIPSLRAVAAALPISSAYTGYTTRCGTKLHETLGSLGTTGVVALLLSTATATGVVAILLCTATYETS